jgi:hypothetical protein
MPKHSPRTKLSKESALSRAFTNGRMRFKRTAPSATRLIFVSILQDQPTDGAAPATGDFQRLRGRPPFLGQRMRRFFDHY